MQTNNTKVSQYAARASEYLKKYGPSGTYTSINAPYGQFMTIHNDNPFFGVYGCCPDAMAGYELAKQAYKPRKRTLKAGETFRF